MWEDHLDHIAVVKELIKLFFADTASEHFTNSQAVLTTRDFEKAKIDKMPSKNVINSTQIKMGCANSIRPRKIQNSAILHRLSQI